MYLFVNIKYKKKIITTAQLTVKPSLAKMQITIYESKSSKELKLGIWIKKLLYVFNDLGWGNGKNSFRTFYTFRNTLNTLKVLLKDGDISDPIFKFYFLYLHHVEVLLNTEIFYTFFWHRNHQTTSLLEVGRIK